MLLINMGKKIIIVKKINEKGLEKLFGCFWFLNHSLRWFLVVPPKYGFTQQTKLLVPLAHYDEKQPHLQISQNSQIHLASLLGS